MPEIATAEGGRACLSGLMMSLLDGMDVLTTHRDLMPGFISM